MRAAVPLLLLAACGTTPSGPVTTDSDVGAVDTWGEPDSEAGSNDDSDTPGVDDTDPPDDTDVLDDTDPSLDTDAPADTDPPVPSDAFADTVVAFTPGAHAGFGADQLPEIVLGPPDGKGPLQGGLDVLSLGEGGSVVLGLDLPGLADGLGPDLLVFENAFPGWSETGVVAVSADGVTWHTFPCDPAATGAPGCAGTHAVLSSPTNGVDPTDPGVAGGDPFDLADLGLDAGFVARFVRVTDSGANALGGLGYAGTTGGFDLDAIAVVNPGP